MCKSPIHNVFKPPKIKLKPFEKRWVQNHILVYTYVRLRKIYRISFTLSNEIEFDNRELKNGHILLYIYAI